MTRAFIGTAREVASDALPVLMGGDHALSLGTVAGVTAQAAAARPTGSNT